MLETEPKAQVEKPVEITVEKQEPVKEQKHAKEPVKEPVKEQEVEKKQEDATEPKMTLPAARTARTNIGLRAPRKSAKTAKLGIKKAPVNFNFEAAEAQAKQDQALEAKYKDNEQPMETKAEPKTTSSRLVFQDEDKNEKKDEYEQLGFGMARLSMPERKSYGETTYGQSTEEMTSARDKFGSARAISSDQYFGRNEYDPAVSAAEQSRLSQFTSAKAISSDMYFGRESESDSYRGQQDTVSLGDWDHVQDNAVAMARRLVDQAALDLDAVKDLAENATNRMMHYFNS